MQFRRIFIAPAFLLPLTFSCGQLPSESPQVTATVDTEMLKQMQNSNVPLENEQELEDGLWQVIVPEAILEQMAEIAHDELNRCGGFFYEGDSLSEELIEPQFNFDTSRTRSMAGLLKIKQETTVNSLIADVQELHIRKTILDLSSFHTRHYKTQQGVDSQNFVHDLWQSLTQSRNDVTLEKVKHKDWIQPSIILTIKGRSQPHEIIVIGGHGDSIAPSFLGLGGTNNHAPGADDNASGIAVMTEVIRVISEGGYQPERTLMFMSYAAEEGGLRGSGEIAKDFKKSGKEVLAVMQLDMVNFNSNLQDPTIAMVTDYTNGELTSYVEQLIDHYAPIKRQQDRCGYACSDHASWHKQGFATVLPHEASNKNRNKKIHTNKDTLDLSLNKATLAEKFAKIALAFTIELGS